LEEALSKNENYYILEFSNLGGLVMPIPLEITFEDGSKELLQIPVEIWRKEPSKTKWLKQTPKKITSVVLDPYWEIADTNIENNYYPRRMIPARLKPNIDKRYEGGKNLMSDLMKRNKEIASHNNQNEQ